MAATVHRLRYVRLPLHRGASHTLRFLSSSDEPESRPSLADDNIPPESGSKSSLASYVKELKGTLKRDSPHKHTRPTPFRFTSPPGPPPSDKLPSHDELLRSLSEFRSRSSPPPPSSGSGQYVSFEELFKKNVLPNASGSSVKPSLRAIQDSLRYTGPKTSPGSTQVDSGGPTISEQMSLGRLKETLKLKSDLTTGIEPPSLTGGISFINKGKKTSEDDDMDRSGEMRTALFRTYGYSELGAELKKLRPDKRKGKWFSLHELNERLAKFRVIDNQKPHGLLGMGEIRKSLESIYHSDAEKKRKQTLQRLDHLGLLGGTPNYMLSPPKEHLVAQYLHPDNMSSAEKLKMELQKVRDEFKISESDCGSARVQVAQLTTKINHLAKALAKKDKHSRKGLQGMVQRRKKLLKYLRRTDFDSYCLVLSKLGLRDNPDLVKA